MCSFPDQTSSVVHVHMEPDIIFDTETWIDNSITNSQIFPRGYTIFRNDRNLSGGFVLIHFVAV
jgi:hypothetical protein